MIWKVKLFLVTVKYEWKMFVLKIRREIYMVKYRLYEKLGEKIGVKQD